MVETSIFPLNIFGIGGFIFPQCKKSNMGSTIIELKSGFFIFEFF
jgi:hypothetical protein